MADPTSPDTNSDTNDETGESTLRGEALTRARHRKVVGNPDTTVRVDDEQDSLYRDGIDLEDDTPPMGTDGRSSDNAR